MVGPGPAQLKKEKEKERQLGHQITQLNQIGNVATRPRWLGRVQPSPPKKG